MDENEKTQVLLVLLAETQTNLRSMRSRVLSILSTAITLFTVSVGWIVQRQTKPTLVETILFSGIILVFGFGHLLILSDIRAGFIKAMRISVRIEKSLNLYDPHFFNGEDESILPASYLKPIKGDHFKKFENILLFSVAASIIILISKYVFG